MATKWIAQSAVSTGSFTRLSATPLMGVLGVDTKSIRWWVQSLKTPTRLCRSGSMPFTLFTTTRHGVPALELQRQLGVAYPTALRMAHKIREHMADTDGENPLDGDVEADETYIGGKVSGGEAWSRCSEQDNCLSVCWIGMVTVMTKVVPNVKKCTLQPIIQENVKSGSTVHTDELRSYKGLDKAGYEHKTVNHGAGKWVSGGSHVNSIEGFWARLKLSIRGTHIHVSKKHLRKYLKEFEFRYNYREKPEQMFPDLIASL